MKPLHLLLAFTTLLPVTCIIGQDKPADTKPSTGQSSPFLKGRNAFTLQRNFKYHDYDIYDEDDNKIESDNTLRFDFDYKRFIADGFAIGLKFDADFSGNHAGNTDDLTRTWSVTPNLTYGKTFASGFNLYLEGGVGFGAYKNIYETPTSSTTDKADLFAIEVIAGAPIALYGNSHTYFTPFISYKNQTITYDDGKEKSSGVNIGFKLEAYPFCSEMSCDKKLALSKNWYKKGDMFLGYTTQGSFEFGTNTTEYNMVPNDYEESFTDGQFKAEFGYYIANYFAIGAGIGIMSEVQKAKDIDSKISQFSFSFMPMAQIHIPVENSFRNVFLQVEGRFGSQKTEYEYASTSNTTKIGVSGWGVNIGHNAFFTRNLSFTTLLGYQLRTEENKDSDEQQHRKGFNVQGGVRYTFKNHSVTVNTNIPGVLTTSGMLV